MDNIFTVKDIVCDINSQIQLLKKYERFCSEGNICMADFNKIAASTTQVMVELNKVLKNLQEIGLEPDGEEAGTGA